MTVKLYLGNCLEVMCDMESHSVDFILSDFPYGVTACDWDNLIDLGLVWVQFKRILKPNRVACLFGTQPFTTDLINSNREWYKYNWVWVKNKPFGFHHARNKPMQQTEDIVIFSQGSMNHQSISGENRMTYNPQGVRKTKDKKIVADYMHGSVVRGRSNQIGKEYDVYTNFPNNVLYYNSVTDGLHPTQKPVDLLEYLIKTYTEEDEVVLDCCFGSGSTGEACQNTKRSFIGIEKDEGFFKIAEQRLSGEPIITEDHSSSVTLSVW